MTADRAKAVLLGHVTGAHGVRGEVRIKTYTAQPLAIADYGPLQDEAGTARFTILAVRPAKQGVIARIEGVATREEAEALKGTPLYVPRAALPEIGAEAEPDTYYHADLIGLVAVSAAGSALGQVVAVHNFGAGDLLEVRPATGGASVLVPFTRAIVPEIDFEAGWMLMIPPEGLFDDE
ncbi:MAG: ribosome maturation factor RimM [Alphaproteobacteria bacterium]|nr:MAG: ribosome maturation factor RimM [Alphaproteobacteria bacterium]